MNFPTYNYANINLLSQVKLVKNKAVRGALIVHNRKNINEVKRWLEILKRKVWVAENHHDLILLIKVMQSIVHDVHLSLLLWEVALNKKIHPQMQLREVSVGSDEVGFIL